MHSVTMSSGTGKEELSSAPGDGSDSSCISDDGDPTLLALAVNCAAEEGTLPPASDLLLGNGCYCECGRNGERSRRPGTIPNVGGNCPVAMALLTSDSEPSLVLRLFSVRGYSEPCSDAVVTVETPTPVTSLSVPSLGTTLVHHLVQTLFVQGNYCLHEIVYTENGHELTFPCFARLQVQHMVFNHKLACNRAEGERMDIKDLVAENEAEEVEIGEGEEESEGEVSNGEEESEGEEEGESEGEEENEGEEEEENEGEEEEEESEGEGEEEDDENDRDTLGKGSAEMENESGTEVEEEEEESEEGEDEEDGYITEEKD